MTYELALQLKEVGFPQNWNNDFYTPEGLIFRQPTNRPIGGREIYIPTLEELIEACGDDLIAIQREDPKNNKGFSWCAVKEWEAYYPPEVSRGQYGMTPEEAVAKLYIELNKK